MRYFIIAGEASGDLHGANLMKSLKREDPDAQFMFFGGDLMLQQGGQLVKHYSNMAFMGFVEVLQNLSSVTENLKLARTSLQEFDPHVVILIDYGGFNLRMAKFAKKLGYKVIYYIAPKVWAWKESRVKKIKKFVDKLIIIFPFEQEYFAKKGVDAVYLGNPIMDTLTPMEMDGEAEKPIIALLPGSRKQELKHNLSRMLSLVDKMPQYEFVIAGAPSLDPKDYHKYIKDYNVKLKFGQTQQILRQATVAVVTSGTATLEAALYDTPEVVCYRGSLPSMLIGWVVIRVKFISLVNLIMDREVVKELIQFKYTPPTLFHEVAQLLPHEEKRDLMLSQFQELRERLGGSGTSNRIAEYIVDFIGES